MSSKLNSFFDSMKKNQPHIFHRFYTNIYNLYPIIIEKDIEKDIIEINRKSSLKVEYLNDLNNDDIENKLENLDDLNNQFRNFCLEACILCENAIFKFYILKEIWIIWTIILSALVTIVTVYKFPFDISLTITLLGCFFNFIQNMSEWEKLSEKYSHIYEEFLELSNSTDKDRINKFEHLVYEYSSRILFTDLMKEHKRIMNLNKK